MSEEEIKETIKTLQSNPLVKCGSYEFIGDSNITYAEIYILLELIRSQEQENQLLKRVKQYCPYDKKCGELYDCTKEEYETMKQSNVKLSLKYDKLKEVIGEVRECFDNNFLESTLETFVCLRKEDYENLKDKLDKVKENEKNIAEIAEKSNK